MECSLDIALVRSIKIERNLLARGLTCTGNFIGPLVFLEEEKPLYTTGWIVTVAPIRLFQSH